MLLLRFPITISVLIKMLVSMKKLVICAGLLLGLAPLLRAEDPLVAGWQNPPPPARLHAYWWWLNGNVTKAAITRDLEEMKAKGFGGAIIYDANGASQDGNAAVPHGPTFFTPPWRALYKHALQEADRLGLEMSLNIQSGWNLGGPQVLAEDAAKKYTWSVLLTSGDTNQAIQLPRPGAVENYYQDVAVVAFQRRNARPPAPLANWKQKALQASLEPFSTPDSSPLFAESPASSDEQDANATEVLDLTTNLAAGGQLIWSAPPGNWEIIRFGYTIADHGHVSTSSEGWPGYAIDVYSAKAFENYWNQIVEPLLQDAGPLVGRSLKYLYTESWEIELANWTPHFRTEFRKRRGYDPLPWLPVLAGRIIDSREASDRFLFDYRQTLGDLVIDNHYRLLRDHAHAHGLLTHPESGGPHAVPIDAQRCLGWNDVPMSEFWAWSWTHRIGDANRFFIKQPASAAHTYGHQLVFAEGFTDIGLHWQENLSSIRNPRSTRRCAKSSTDLFWHAFSVRPTKWARPGSSILPAPT